MFKILVTGASGLVGRRLCMEAVMAGYTVFATLHNSSIDYGLPVKLDLLNPDSISMAYERSKPDVVVHAAALTDVDRCEYDRELAFKLNHEATLSMAIEARRYGSFFIYISTDYVFDGEKGMYREEDDTNPVNIYGMSKLRGEKAVMETLERWCILRISTPYGRHTVKKTFPELVIENLKANQRFKAAYDQYTSPTYIPNFCKIVLEVIEKEVCGILHASGSTRISRLQLAHKIAKLLNLDERLIEPVSISDFKFLAKRPKDSSLDTSKASSLLREKPMGIEEGLKKFIRDLGYL